MNLKCTTSQQWYGCIHDLAAAGHPPQGRGKSEILQNVLASQAGSVDNSLMRRSDDTRSHAEKPGRTPGLTWGLGYRGFSGNLKSQFLPFSSACKDPDQKKNHKISEPISQEKMPQHRNLCPPPQPPPTCHSPPPTFQTQRASAFLWLANIFF